MDDHRLVVLQAGYRAEVRLLTVDVDHTLFDWFACVGGDVSLAAGRRDESDRRGRRAVLDELGALHRAAGSSEPPTRWAPCAGAVAWRSAGTARGTHRGVRRAVEGGDAALAACPGVQASLQRVRAAGTAVVACRGTAPDLVLRRVQRLGLLADIDALASAWVGSGRTGPPHRHRCREA